MGCFQFHWMDSRLYAWGFSIHPSNLSIPLDGFRPWETVTLVLPALTFNSIGWIPGPKYLQPILDFIYFQFHWMDSLKTLASHFSTLHTILSIPLDGFETSLKVVRELEAVYFQFHWMDSGDLLTFNKLGEGGFFQFHWMDSYVLRDNARGQGMIFQFHWMDSGNYGWRVEIKTR